MLRKILFFLSALFLLGCGQLGPLTEAEEGKTSSDPEQGVTKETVDPAAGGNISIDDGSAIAGTEVTIPAGALAVATEITIEEGSSLVADDTTLGLGLDPDNTIGEAGPAVAILPEVDTDPTQPLTLAIPLSGTTALLQEGLAVLYKIKKQNGELFAGILTKTTVEGGKLKFETQFFGVFQAIKLAKPLTQDVQVKTVAPITVRRKSTELEGAWTEGCSVDEQSNGTKESERGLIVFSGNHFKFRSLRYQDEGCKTLMISQQLQGEFVISGEAVVSGAKNIDISLKQRFLAVHQTDVLGCLNAIKACGIADWVLHDPRDISSCDIEEEFRTAKVTECGEGDNGSDKDTTTDGSGDSGTDNGSDDGSNCEDGGGPEVGSDYYQIFSIVDNVLYFGDDSADDGSCERRGDTPENRPTRLEEQGMQKRIL